MSHRNAPLHLCKINLSIFLFKAALSSLPVILEIGTAIYPVALCTLSELSKMLSFHAYGLCQKLFRGISLPSVSGADFFKLFVLYLSVADKQTMLL